MDVTAITHDRYYTYAELTAALEALAAAYPHLAKLYSIGQTFQQREIWVMEITHSATGPGSTKPGFYIDAHIHAEEHVTSSVALYAAWYLLLNFEKDATVTRLVNEQVFYIFPRLNPDGAELSLTPPYYRWVGNGRFRPGEERSSGLIPEDLDGDGFITNMLVPDPTGEWKKSEADPGVLVQRRPGEQGGTYFRLYPEGRIRDYDGVNVAIERPRDGNLNRNFPIGWEPDPPQYGAGSSPLSEPETRALVDFIEVHPNIAGMCTYHSHGGVMLRPSMTKPDTAMPPQDLELYRAIGEVATELTGYPTISVFEEFTPDKERPRRGGFEDLTYETLGIVCFGPEVWDIEQAAGVKKTAYYGLHPRDEASMLQVLRWVRDNVGEQGFREWRPFDHPQLGPVEIGGLVDIWTYRNPPPALLEEICHQNVLFNLEHASAAPQIRIDSLDIVPLEGDLYRVVASISNHGYLPTNLTQVAIDNGVAVPVEAEIHLEGAELLTHPSQVELGHLAGRNERRMPWSPWGPQWTATARRVAWMIKTKKDDVTVTIEARSQRAGQHRITQPINSRINRFA
jgi:murein tripeptide amidase MpaA